MKRFVYYLSRVPVAWKRWLTHFGWVFFPDRYANAFPPGSKREWLVDLFFYTLDITGFPFWYEIFTTLFKKSVRPLHDRELQEAKSIFGDSLRYDLIRIDTKPYLGLGKDVVAYVTFFTIRYKRRINMPILIHELVHVWQFQQFGSVYISKALKAQKSREGYDYGGTENLYHGMLTGQTLTSFNFEQQAEIIEDYYRFSRRLSMSPLESGVYAYYAACIGSGKKSTGV
jgi:hypothetical protein